MEARLLNSKQVNEQPLWQQRLLLAQSPLTLITSSSSMRPTVESFISERFLQSYGAQLKYFLPFLLASLQVEEVSAAIGFQPATKRPLFLENYLDKPIELSLPESVGLMPRKQIVEIGNLAASFQAGSPLLFVVIAAILHQAGFHYVVFTATSQVRKLLDKFQLKTDIIGPADPLRLPDKGEAWGQYYLHEPIILGGGLAYAVEHLSRHQVIKAALIHHADFINETAKQIGFGNE